MKNKTKMMATLEIAIVLGLLFLTALPATTIAAEQDDYILGIYGNANEDDTIDMRDLTCVKLIFFGKKPETELADAKYDGKINPLDFIQIKLIIVGKEKELTVVDTVGRAVTIDKPLLRLAVLNWNTLEVMRSLKQEKEITGGKHFIAAAYMAKWLYPELFKDLDPKAIHQEYLTRFQGLDFDLDGHGVFVYHLEEHPDGK